MKKVLIFSLSYYPHIGGAEIAIKEITDRIDPKDIEFHLICNRYDTALPKIEMVGNVHVHRIGFGKKHIVVSATYRPFFYLAKILFVPLSVLKARSLHQAYRFDGAWAMMTYMVMPIVLLRLFGVRLPYAVTVQEGDSFERVFGRRRIRMVMPLVRFGMRHAVAVQAISSFLGEWPKKLGFRGTVQVIPNGVDVAHFSKHLAVEERRELRHELLCGTESTLLMHVGRIVPKNGLEDVIKALTLLPAHISFVQVGVGPDRDKLEALAQALGVADRVRFLGFIDHAVLPKYLHAADIFVQPSHSEGMGNVFIEAMAAGVPVVATQVGGIADFLFDSELNPAREPTGRAVQPHDPEGIARAIRLYLEDQEATRRIVQNALALVTERYDWKRVVEEMRARVFNCLFV